MSGDDNPRHIPAPAPTTEQSKSADSSDDGAGNPPPDRAALINRARTFLTSPHIQHQDVSAKRRFLAEKGLDADEISGLMRELPPQPPPVPLRTYPRPPPSNLPLILTGLARLFTWMAGGSAVLLFIYYRFLLPRLTRSALARRALKTHQAGLFERLSGSLAALKAAQADAFAALPRPRAAGEPPAYRAFRTLDDIPPAPDAPRAVPPYTLLRCALAGLAAEGRAAGTEELFAMLEERFPWLASEEGLEHQNTLWDTLSGDAAFAQREEGERTFWTHTAPPANAPAPADADAPADAPVPAGAAAETDSAALVSALSALRAALPPPRPASSARQHALQAAGDLTGYITTQTYSLAAAAYRVPGMGFAPALGPQEEEVRREIRALKGLVLNRRTFTTGTWRPPTLASVESEAASVP